MKWCNLTFRIQVAPANVNAYFRVMNSGGNYLSANGSVLSDVFKQVFRILTHFYFQIINLIIMEDFMRINDINEILEKYDFYESIIDEV